MAIEKLPELIIAQIAAGEVIESPVSVIKELLENSIDAGATNIEIIIEDLGLSSIQIRDNGNGITKEDLPLALEGFATSKLKKTDDLYNISTMGFRGEALSSIRSISKVTIESREKNSEFAWKITAEGESLSEIKPSSYPGGTRIQVDNLFFNVPIRKKFISGEKKIRQQIIETIISYALIHFEVSFYLIIDREVVINHEKAQSMEKRIEQLYTSKFLQSMTALYFHNDIISISGLISGSGFYHSRPVFIKFFVNKRPVEIFQANRLLRKIYGELLPPGKFPAAFIFIEISPSEIDVNVHPQKKEIRFKNENEFFQILENAVKQGIENKGALNLNRKINQVISRKPFYQAPQPESLFLHEIEIQIKDNLPVENISISAAPETESRISIMPQIIHTTLFNTFILATSDEGLFLFDQHTVHERIQYERFKEGLGEEKIISQNLLEPVNILLSASENDILKRNPEIFKELGFDIEDFGPAGLKINSLPTYLAKGQEEEAVKIILEFVSSDSRAKPDKVFDKMVKSLSCRSAIKKGDTISLNSHKDIIKQLYKCREPLRCPHGRPTVIHFSRDDIHNLFNRPFNR